MTTPELSWRRSSKNSDAGQCVEVAALPGGGVAVRNSGDPNGAILRFTPAEWDAFIAGARDGEFAL